MINFKNPQERVPSTLIVLSLLILAGTLGYMVFVPAPSVAGTARGRERSRRTIQQEIQTTRKTNKELQQRVTPLLWQGSVESITSRLLARVTSLVNQQNLKMGAFRPQRSQALDGVTELPFSVQVSGPYPHVHALMDALDTPQSRVVLSTAQVASSDSATDAVTLTLTISAFTTTPETATSPTKGGASK